MTGKPRTRGHKRPRNDEGAITSRLAAVEAVAGSISGTPADVAVSIHRSRVEYWNEINATLAEAATYAAKIAMRALKQVHDNPGDPESVQALKGLKDVATIAAIFVDKGAVIDTTLATLGQTRGSDVTDLEKRIAMLLVANSEMQRRIAEQQPLDVTPKPPK